jgi:plastocyanin
VSAVYAVSVACGFPGTSVQWGDLFHGREEVTPCKGEDREARVPVPLACVLSLAGLLAGPAGAQNADENSEAKPNTVTMKSLSYDPKSLEVHVGDSVAWTNAARTRHTATSDDEEGKTFDTGAVEPGTSSQPVKFEKAGEIKCHCKIHGKTMSGTIVVKPAGSGTTR